jgi:hypothetical protein
MEPAPIERVGMERAPEIQDAAFEPEGGDGASSRRDAPAPAAEAPAVDLPEEAPAPPAPPEIAAEETSAPESSPSDAPAGDPFARPGLLGGVPPAEESSPEATPRSSTSFDWRGRPLN